MEGLMKSVLEREEAELLGRATVLRCASSA